MRWRTKEEMVWVDTARSVTGVTDVETRGDYPLVSQLPGMTMSTDCLTWHTEVAITPVILARRPKPTGIGLFYVLPEVWAVLALSHVRLSIAQPVAVVKAPDHKVVRSSPQGWCVGLCRVCRRG